MSANESEIEFKLNNIKAKVLMLNLPAKRVRKIHAKQKINNILVESESFERYIMKEGKFELKELTLWVDIKVFGGHKYKPAYNYELHSNFNSKYNQIYDVTNDIQSIKNGSEEYETLQRFVGFITKNFDEYIANFVNVIIQMNNGKSLTGVPRFILDMGDMATNKANTDNIIDKK